MRVCCTCHVVEYIVFHSAHNEHSLWELEIHLAYKTALHEVEHVLLSV